MKMIFFRNGIDLVYTMVYNYSKKHRHAKCIRDQDIFFVGVFSFRG